MICLSEIVISPLLNSDAQGVAAWHWAGAVAWHSAVVAVINVLMCAFSVYATSFSFLFNFFVLYAY